MFFCEYYEIFQNTFLYWAPRVAAFEDLNRSDLDGELA